MRFIYFLLLAFVFSSTLKAGTGRNLEWYSSKASGMTKLDFKGSVHPNEQVLPLFSETQMPDVQASGYIARLVYPVYQVLNAEEIKQFSPYLEDCSDSIVVETNVGTQRKKQVLDLLFSPFIKRKGAYYKLLSFSWDIKPIQTDLRALATDKALISSVSMSKLASGKWKKISVTETGMYMLTYSDILAMGINPKNVQIYGFGGALLEERFSLSGYVDDLPELPVWKETGYDGIFNEGDYLLFYAQGPVSWKYDASSSFFNRVRNHYSDKSYYFVGERTQGTKTPLKTLVNGTPNYSVLSYTDHTLHEVERVNIGESALKSGTGRQLYGEDFIENSSQTFNFEVPNVDTTDVSKMQIEFIARSNSNTFCEIRIDDVWPDRLSFSPIQSSDEYQYAYSAKRVVPFIPLGNKTSVRLDYFQSGDLSTQRAFLDCITLNSRCTLKMSGSSLFFREPKSVGANRLSYFFIRDASDCVVFDVTKPLEMFQVDGAFDGIDYFFKTSTTTLKEFVCVSRKGTFPKPTLEGDVPPQNIHGHSPVDMVVISPPEFIPYAKTLAEAHQRNDGLRTLIVTPEQVYNEFSSGTPDATAFRRMMKFFYDRTTTENDLPKYLLLFGDGVYDNRLVSNAFLNSKTNLNKILTYQSSESLDGNQSYVTDDYFGFLDNNEGSNLSSDKLDIGVGRFPVSTIEQANIAVNKTISYMEKAKKGVWKNQLLFIADDGNDYLHENQAEQLANRVGYAQPALMIHKIYVDAFNKVTSVSGTTVPEANSRFAELLNSGLLMVNYVGHGSTTQWAEEKLLTVPQIQSMTNNCLPLWVTATCDFSRYDAVDPSGGEKLFLNPTGGGIALFTTSRVVYSGLNFLINASLIDHIFSKSEGVRYTLGEIMNKSKGSEELKGDRNKLSFTLIGDPALKLAYPEYSAQIISINDKIVSSTMDTLRALSRVHVSGKINREDGSWASDFNGLIFPTVLDAEDVLMTSNYYGLETTYYEKNKVLFSGKDSVKNGIFNFDFVVPKDISYSDKTGSINLYAYDEKGTNEAQGSYNRILLAGTTSSYIADAKGPNMHLFLNNYNFVSGGVVNEKPTFLAKISDVSGLNTSGNGIGHDLILTVDGSTTKTYKLNNYFTADVGSYTSGIVQFVLPELAAGKHLLSLKSWDIQNISSIDTLFFVVKPGLKPVVSDIKYAQKGESAQIVFTHDRPETDLKVEVGIYDLLGQKVWFSVWLIRSDVPVINPLEWNLSDQNGRRVANGIYICKIRLTDSNGAQTSKAENIQVSSQ